LQPIPVSLFSQDGYYLDMLLSVGDKTQVVSPGQDLSEASVRTAIESALKRSSQGFLKVVGLWTPPAAQTDQLGQQSPGSLATYQTLQQRLGQDYSVRSIDLQSGQVPPDVDTLVVIAPQNMTDKERYAIDQYLMRHFVIGAGNYASRHHPRAVWVSPLQNGLPILAQGRLADAGDGSAERALSGAGRAQCGWHAGAGNSGDQLPVLPGYPRERDGSQPADRVAAARRDDELRFAGDARSSQERESHDFGVIEVQSQRMAHHQHPDRTELSTLSADGLCA
jgi:hypothetical protein